MLNPCRLQGRQACRTDALSIVVICAFATAATEHNTVAARRLGVHFSTGTGAAGADSTAEFRARQSELIPDDPQQRSVRLDVNHMRIAVHIELYWQETPLPIEALSWYIWKRRPLFNQKAACQGPPIDPLRHPIASCARIALHGKPTRIMLLSCRPERIRANAIAALSMSASRSAILFRYINVLRMCLLVGRAVRVSVPS